MSKQILNVFFRFACLTCKLVLFICSLSFYCDSTYRVIWLPSRMYSLLTVFINGRARVTIYRPFVRSFVRSFVDLPCKVQNDHELFCM